MGELRGIGAREAGSTEAELELPASLVRIARAVDAISRTLGAARAGLGNLAVSGASSPIRSIDTWGRLPAFTAAAATALFLMASADALSRSGRGGGQTLFWIAVFLPVVAAAFRLASQAPARRERIGIVVVLGVTLYLVKVLQNPFAFLYSDEFVHAYNAQRALDSGELFHENPLLKVTPYYPGLSSATSAVASLTGMHVFGAGLVVIGVARVVLMLALFLLFEELTRSARVAGIAVLVYTAHPNFLFFVSQYAYESLALPIAAVAMAGVVRWMRREDEAIRRIWAFAALLATAAVVVTHHMTSYALVGFLVGVSLVHRIIAGRTARSSNPWPFAQFAGAATIRREGAPRPLFASEYGVGTPILERGVAYAFIALIAAALPFALWEVWRRYRQNAVVVMFAAACSLYLGIFLLRFVPRAWEVANRASEFLFIGVALMLALVAVRVVDACRGHSGQLLLAAAATVLFAGGVVAGWPRDLRLGLPYRIVEDGRVLEPQGSTAARWSKSHLGAGAAFVADESNARLLLAQGEKALTGSNPAFGRVLDTSVLEPWMVDLLTENGLRYVVMDRRVVRNDRSTAYFFVSPRAERLGLLPQNWQDKLDRQPGVSRLFDSGEIAIYDVARLRYDPKRP